MFLVRRRGDLEGMVRASSIVADVLRLMRDLIRPGVSTGELDRRAEKLIRDSGGIPAFKGYRLSSDYPPYPASICASINDEVVHGIPREDRFLEEGDIVSIDVGVKALGFYGDGAATYPVGAVSPERARLIEVTRRALYVAIEQARVGKTLGDLGHAVESFVRSQGFEVVRTYSGHGIGKKLHDSPHVPNFGIRGAGLVIPPGLALAIEPMVNAGSHRVRTLEDGWTVVTEDGSDSAHFEHTVVVCEEGPKILTLWEETTELGSCAL